MKYQEDAAKTEAPISQPLLDRLSDPTIARLLHGAIGLDTEVGELMDALKKHIYYGKPLDLVNVKEELGDLMWYIALICNTVDVDMQTVMDRNIEKLAARYPDKFTEEDALNRNLDKERDILES